MRFVANTAFVHRTDRLVEIDADAPKLLIGAAQSQSFGRSDRERQNLLAIRGWLILRFTCGQIYREMNEIKAMVDAAVEQRRGDEQPSLS